MITPDKYADKYLAEAYRYADQVEDGSITTNTWIKKAVARFRRDLLREEFVQDPEAVLRVFKFFSLLQINIKNQYRQLEIIPYQAFIILNLFLFYHKETGRRRFRYMFLFVARKNSKSVFAVALNLYFLVLDGVEDPQVLLLASTREQATIALDYAKSIIHNSPALHRRLKIMQYQIRFEFGNSRGFMKTLASESKRLDGYNPSSAILDEIHAYPDDELFNVIKSGILARDNPMIILITTAGFSINGFCFNMVENAKNILLENVTDDSTLAILYTLDEGDDYKNPDNWIKANPAIGTIISPEDLMIEYNQGINMSSQLPNFLTKHLNIFVESSTAWIPEDVLQRTNVPFNLSRFEGMDVYIGLDLSSTRDLTSIVLLFFDPDENMFYAEPLFFIAKNPERRLRQGGIDLRPWIRSGLIIECQTETIDYNLLFEWFENLDKRFNIVAVGFDPYSSDLLVPRLNEVGINTVRFDQTARNFNFPLKYLEKLIYDRGISLGGNPVLLWNIRNVVLYSDGNGNIKILKNKSRDAVDGAVALGEALAMYLSVNLDSQKMNLSAYLERN